MTDRVTYKLGIDIVSPNPTGAGGTLIQDNFKAIADHVETIKATTDGLGTVATYDVGTTAGTVPVLQTGGKLPTSTLPDLAVVDYLGGVATQSAMLLLTGQKGDWCTRTDLGKNYIITGNDPTQLGSWTALSYPVSSVISVAGKTGAVTLGISDITSLTSTLAGKLSTSGGGIGGNLTVSGTVGILQAPDLIDGERLVNFGATQHLIRSSDGVSSQERIRINDSGTTITGPLNLDAATFTNPTAVKTALGLDADLAGKLDLLSGGDVYGTTNFYANSFRAVSGAAADSFLLNVTETNFSLAVISSGNNSTRFSASTSTAQVAAPTVSLSGTNYSVANASAFRTAIGVDLSNIVFTSNTITSPGTELVLRQTGDEYGSSTMYLRNRGGYNGAFFKSGSGLAAELVDFGFENAGGTANASLRFENRSANCILSSSNPEFQLGKASSTEGIFTAAGLAIGLNNAAGGIAVCNHGSVAGGRSIQIVGSVGTNGNAKRSAGRIVMSFAADSTDASRKGRVIHSVYDTSERECIRLEASGTAPKIGFFGAAAVTKPTVTGSRSDGTALANLLTALANLGLITDSTTA